MENKPPNLIRRGLFLVPSTETGQLWIPQVQALIHQYYDRLNLNKDDDGNFTPVEIAQTFEFFYFSHFEFFYFSHDTLQNVQLFLERLVNEPS